MEHKQTLADELAQMEIDRLAKEEEEEEHHHHHHHDHDEDEEHDHCCHHHDHDEDEEHDHCCHHDHEDHDEDEEHDHCCHHDHEDHDEDEEHDHCCCGHDHEHHHHHHADEVFTSWGVETAKKFSREALQNALSELDSGEYGAVLRAKGILAADDGTWIHFDYVPGEEELRTGPAAVIGRLCVIGSKLDEKAIAQLFGV